MTTPRHFAAACVFSMVVAAPALAQQCLPADTLIGCWQKFNEPASFAAETQRNVTTANTGNTAIASPTASPLLDFLSLFTASADNATAGQNGKSVTLDWNVPVPLFGADRSLKLQALFAEPDLSQGVTDALPTDNAAVSKLRESLDNTDDIQISASYSPVDRRYGRSIGPHVAVLDALVRQAISSSKALDAARRQALAAHPEIESQDTPFSAVADPTAQGELIRIFEDSARAQHDAIETATALVTSLTRLVNNQPQMYGSILYHARRDLVGPNEWSARFTYEIGSDNMNRFLGGAGASCRPDATGVIVNPKDCYAAFTRYAQAGRSSPETADRMALSVEYSRKEKSSIDLSKYSVVNPIVTDDAHSFVFSFTYGHTIVSNRQRRDGRLDLSIDYEDRHGGETTTAGGSTAPSPKDRLVSTLTYTQKLSDTLTLPLSIVYENHDSLRTDVDRQIGVHFGINFKLPGRKEGS